MLHKALTKKKAYAFVATALDEVACEFYLFTKPRLKTQQLKFCSACFYCFTGLFNLRGSDVEYNPVFFAYAIITMDNVR